MTEEKNKWIDAIAKMIKLTQDGKLVWEAVKSLDELLKKQPDDKVGIPFQTTYKGKTLRIYKRTYKDYRPAPSSTASAQSLSRFFGIGSDVEPYWATEVVMEFLSKDGLSLWTYPQVDVLSDLFSAIQYQVAGVKDFLNEILSDEG